MTGQEAIEKMKTLTSPQKRAEIAVEFLCDAGNYVERPTGWGESCLRASDEGRMVGLMARDGIRCWLAIYDNSCLQGVTTHILRGHLYALAANRPGDDEVAQHLATGCIACEKRAQAIRFVELPAWICDSAPGSIPALA